MPAGILDHQAGDQRQRNIAHQIAAGGPHQLGQTAGVAGKHRYAREAQHQIYHAADRPPFPAQQTHRQIDGQGTQGDGDRPDGYGQRRQHADDRRHHSTRRQLIRLSPLLFCHSSSSTFIVNFFVPYQYTILRVDCQPNRKKRLQFWRTLRLGQECGMINYIARYGRTPSGRRQEDEPWVR